MYIIGARIAPHPGSHLHSQAERPGKRPEGPGAQPFGEGLAEVDEALSGEAAAGGAHQSSQGREGVALLG